MLSGLITKHSGRDAESKLIATSQLNLLLPTDSSESKRVIPCNFAWDSVMPEIGIIWDGELAPTCRMLLDMLKKAGQILVNSASNWTESVSGNCVMQILDNLCSKDALPKKTVFRRIRVELRSGCGSLIEIESISGCSCIIIVDVDLLFGHAVKEYGLDRVVPIYALSLLYVLGIIAGYSGRQSLHFILGSIDNHDGQPMIMKETLLSILGGDSSLPSFIDKNETFVTFIRDIQTAERSMMADCPELFSLKTIDTMNLEAFLHEGGRRYHKDGNDIDPERAIILKTAVRKLIHFRDKKISWFELQNSIDLPYDRLAFREALSTSDAQARRQATFEVIKEYNHEKENRNCSVICSLIRKSWLVDEDSMHPIILVGRESRAYGNQAFLFASSNFLRKSEEVRKWTENLVQLSEGSLLKLNFEAILEDCGPSVREVLRPACNKILVELRHLGPAVSRTRQLVFSPSNFLPYTQCEGALSHLNEAIGIFNREACIVVESARKSFIDSVRDLLVFRESSMSVMRKSQPDVALSLPFGAVFKTVSDFCGAGGQLYQTMWSLQEELLQLSAVPAAFSVLLQRPSLTGAERFKSNELVEKPEQEEPLQRLVRLGGNHIYMSPSMKWVSEATDIIEAVPLFIYERTLKEIGPDGKEKETTIFEVDQDGLEQTIRQLADHLADNISNCMDSEYAALAREVVIFAHSDLQTSLNEFSGSLSFEAACREIISQVQLPEKRELIHKMVTILSAKIKNDYESGVNEFENYVEEHWSMLDFVTRLDALRGVLFSDQSAYGKYLKSAMNYNEKMKDEQSWISIKNSMAAWTIQRQRPVPAFHLLTTEAPGLVEGFIQTVLEEEMSLYNVIKAKNLEDSVKDTLRRYARDQYLIGEILVREFGFSPLVSEHEKRGFSRQQAVSQVISDHVAVQVELAKLFVLYEVQAAEKDWSLPNFEEMSKNEPNVSESIYREQGESLILPQALHDVWERNKTDPDVEAWTVGDDCPSNSVLKEKLMNDSEENPYREEVLANMRWLARSRAIEFLDSNIPAFHVKDRVSVWYRQHNSLRVTTARREVVAKEGLNALTNHALYAYSAGVMIEDSHSQELRPTGSRKRYHLVYAPSRVNLGKNERVSVEKWPQWVGVGDPLAAKHARGFYELINFDPQMRNIREAENLKVSENQWTALVRAVRNVHAYFIERNGVGDIEDLAYEFNQRSGLAAALIKERETYMSGPTAGYCFTTDHQLLTNKGFMFLDEVQRELEDPQLLLAGYHPDEDKIVYERPLGLVVNPSAKQSVVDLTQLPYNDGSSDISNGFSLIVTPEHDMYVKRGRRRSRDSTSYNFRKPAFERVKADQLVSSDEMDACAFLGSAKGGVVGVEDTPEDLGFVTELNLRPCDIDIFLELYGFWLGDGSLEDSCITFAQVKGDDNVWIKSQLKALDQEYNVGQPTKNGQVRIRISDRVWVDYFTSQYGHKYTLKKDTEHEVGPMPLRGFVDGDKMKEDGTVQLPPPAESIKSAKWFWYWVWRLNARQQRLVIRGLQRADGVTGRMRIHTSSVRFRDEIVQLMLHAGYSVSFKLIYSPGDIRGTDAAGKEIIARHHGWMIVYADKSNYQEPKLRNSRDISRQTYEGRTWCATMPSGFVVVRRALEYDDDFVSSASRPTIQFNCIPKDLLFKLFVARHQDPNKMKQIGIPSHLHSGLIRMMAELSSERDRVPFQTVGEWEKWCCEQFLSPEALRKWFYHSEDDSALVSKHFAKYIDICGGVVSFHVTQMTRLLGRVGTPSVFLSRSNGRDLHSMMWASWADRKITLGGEQVNRSLVFSMTREIPEGVKQAAIENPNVDVVKEKDIRVHFFGTYKSDEDESPPPDVRYAWTMRAFMILAGFGREVALSLDSEGQVLARLSWEGFRPNSHDPLDVSVVKYLAGEHLGSEARAEELATSTNREIVSLREKLCQHFPEHNTVGDITITIAPGVTADDLLGFSAETLTLLGDEAKKLQDIIEHRYGLSVDHMQANSVLRRVLENWEPKGFESDCSSRLDELSHAISKSIHALVLKLRGPGNSFLADLQGQDVAVFSVTHPELMALPPSHLRDLMMVGRPNSALVALDFVAQGKHRVWFDRDVMLWYSACRAIDSKGMFIPDPLDSNSRSRFGRKSVYKAFGQGTDSYMPLLGTDLRTEVANQERRASTILSLLSSLVDAERKCNNASADTEIASSAVKLASVMAELESTFVQICNPQRLSVEAEIAREYEQRMLLKSRYHKRDSIIRKSLEDLSLIGSSPKPLESLSVVNWLCIGGIYLLNGLPWKYQQQALQTVRNAERILNSGISSDMSITIDTIDPEWKDLIVSELVLPREIHLSEKKGEMFSVKASEEVREKAVARRKALMMEAAIHTAERYRSISFVNTIFSIFGVAGSSKSIHWEMFHKLVRQASSHIELIEDQTIAARKCIEKLIEKVKGNNSTADLVEAHQSAGEILARACSSFALIVCNLYPNDEERKESLIRFAWELSEGGSGRILGAESLESIIGTYEDRGVLADLFEIAFDGPVLTRAVREKTLQPDARISALFNVTELLYLALAVEKTEQFLAKPIVVSEEILDHEIQDEKLLFRALAEFYSKNLNDHFHEFSPWFLDTSRVPVFSFCFDSGNCLSRDWAEQFYMSAWKHHSTLYWLFRTLLIHRSPSFARLSETIKDDLLGVVSENEPEISLSPLGVGSNEHDGTGPFERLWWCYCQIRELAFMKNDGFDWPYVLTDSECSKLRESMGLDDHSNFVFLAGTGRTHLSHALMEGPALGENLFITRTGSIQLIGGEFNVLHIHDAFFWTPYHIFKELRNVDVEPQYQPAIGAGENEFLATKGVFVAARFKKPVLCSAAFSMHHHPLSVGLAEAGYPTTDQSPVLYEMTYNKSIYPLIYNPSDETGVYLPPEIDWLATETVLLKNAGQSPSTICEHIAAWLRPFAAEHGILIVKGASESGARNLLRCDMYGSDGRLSKQSLLKAAANIYEISQSQNVTIQKAIISTPLTWMTSQAISNFVNRQVIDHAVAVNLEKFEKDYVYGTLRVILSAGLPEGKIDASSPWFQDRMAWEVSHPISLSSLQIATNVGRQGTLEMLTLDGIQERYREMFLSDLESAGRNVMTATARFGHIYYHSPLELKDGQTIRSFKKSNPSVPEYDGLGVPYHWPRYLMLDFLPEPVWGYRPSKDSDLIEAPKGSRMVDITVGSDVVCTLELPNGERVEGEAMRFTFWLLEPNVGIGLWPNYWRRELERQHRLVNEGYQGSIDWSMTGVSDRKVLKNWIAAGRTFISSHLGITLKTGKELSPGKLDVDAGTLTQIENEFDIMTRELRKGIRLVSRFRYSQIPLCERVIEALVPYIRHNSKQDYEESVELATETLRQCCAQDSDIANGLIEIMKFEPRLSELIADRTLSYSMCPPIDLSTAPLKTDDMSTFAVIVQNRALLGHSLMPWLVGGNNIRRVAGHVDWLTFEGSTAVLRRALIASPQSVVWHETDLNPPMKVDAVFITELYPSGEHELHSSLSKRFLDHKTIVLNASRPCDGDDKHEFRKLMSSHSVPVPKWIVVSSLSDPATLGSLMNDLVSSCKEVVVQPRFGTGGFGVTVTDSEDEDMIISNISSITGGEKDNVVLSEKRGDLYYGKDKLPFVLRIHVTGKRHVTGITIVGGSRSSRIASLFEGSAVSLSECLGNLVDESGNHVPFRARDWDKCVSLSLKVASIVSSKIIGLDFVVERGDGGIGLVLLECNLRPGTLVFSERPTSFESLDGSMSHSLPTSSADEKLWELVF